MAATHSNLPVRSDTLKSSDAGYLTDEDTAISDAAPSDTVGILLERLQAWKHCCAYLEGYVKATEKMLKEHSKDYSKVLKSVSDPLREGHHFDQNLGGIAGLFENIRTNTQALSNSYLETSKSLDGQVLPILERLHKEIKNKYSELNSGAGKSAKAVETAKNETQKRIELLGQHTASYESAGGKLDASSDPYLVRRGVRYMLHKQILEENNSRQDLISVEQNFQTFEAHVVGTFQQAFGQLLQYTGGRAEREKAVYSDITQTAQSIAPDFEWNKFLHRSGNLMVDPNAPQRQLSHITYPNMDHGSTKPLIAGTLERKGQGVKALAGWKTGYFVVTPTKYFHQFESDDDLRQDPGAELSLYLPDCSVGSVSENKFNVKGKDASKGKIGSAFQMSHEFAFKAQSPADAQKWRDIIASVATSTNEVPSDSAIASPISPSEDDRLPPPNTDVPTKHVPVGTTGQTVTGHSAAPTQSAAATGPTTSTAPVPVAATGAAGQTSGVVDHAVATPAAPTTATTASPGAEVLGKGPQPA